MHNLNLFKIILKIKKKILLGCVVQSVMCLATDASLTADPGVANSIPFPSHTVVEIDHEIISMVMSVTSESMCTKYWLTACSSLPRKSVVR